MKAIKLSKKALKATDSAINIIGGTAAVAKAFGFRSSEAVRKWKKSGVPAGHVLEFVRLATASGATASCHAIRPDKFPEGV